MQRTPDTFLPSCTWHYPPSHCLTCVWHQNSSCNTTCHFPSVQVGILAAPHAWGVVDIPCGWGSESLIRAILVIAKAEVMYPPESYGFLQLWTVGAGFKHTRVFLSSSAIPDFFLQCSKAGFHFNVPGIGFDSFPAKASSTLAEHSGKANLSTTTAQKGGCE